jgi:hypothetical protein
MWIVDLTRLDVSRYRVAQLSKFMHSRPYSAEI